MNIIGSKLYSWGELVGRTGLLLGGIFFIFFVAGLWMFRRRVELAPFLVYFVVMFIAMGLLFTFHAPKGAFYHSAPAWLPWAYGDRGGRGRSGAAPRRAGCGRSCAARGRTGSSRWPAWPAPIALSVLSSAILFAQWDRSRVRDEQAAAFLRANAEPGDVFMASDPASLHPLTDLPGLAAPFDPFAVIEEVVDAYDVQWVVVLRPGPGETDPLNLWDGAAGVDSQGEHPSFLPAEPAFEGDDVRVFRVVDR